MINVVVIGGGSVAQGLVREIARAQNLQFVQQWARKTHSPDELAAADIYILAVSDGAVSEVSGSLPFARNAVVAHTAGCVPLEGLSDKIDHRAVLYPFQSFTRGREIADFRATPFFVEGSTPHALETVKKVANALSDNVVEMSSDKRAHIHLAGAFANNFSNAMLSLGEIIAGEAGETFDCLRPIVSETFAKALSMPSPRLAQTGAAQRGDKTIQACHLAILRARHPELVDIYKLVSDRIWQLSKKN